MLRLLPFVLALPAAAQTTWHVDVQGTPPGTGTPADPYTSLQFAIDQATTLDGDTLLVAPGLYLERVDFHPKTLSVRSSGGPLQTTIQLPPSETGSTVTMDFSGGGLLEGFSVVGRAEGGTLGVTLDQGTLRSCIVRDHHSGGAGVGGGIGIVSIGVSTDNNVERCTIVDNLTGASDAVFSLLFLSDCVLAANQVDLWQNGNGLHASWSVWHSQDGFVSGANNILGDAGLWNAPEGDPHLAPQSPCIDSGSPLLPTDPDGSPADRGAVPFDAAYLPQTTVYCTAKVNSAGCGAAISIVGAAAASTTAGIPFLIEADDVLSNAGGLLFYGTSGRRAVPFFGGFHCVEPPTTRTPGQASGALGTGPCKGRFSFDFNAWLQTPIGSLVEPGQVVDAQYWYRDPADPFGSATSDAVEFPVVP